jgi:hypothetical protein
MSVNKGGKANVVSPFANLSHYVKFALYPCLETGAHAQFLPFGKSGYLHLELFQGFVTEEG